MLSVRNRSDIKWIAQKAVETEERVEPPAGYLMHAEFRGNERARAARGIQVEVTVDFAVRSANHRRDLFGVHVRAQVLDLERGLKK